MSDEETRLHVYEGIARAHELLDELHGHALALIAATDETARRAAIDALDATRAQMDRRIARMRQRVVEHYERVAVTQTARPPQRDDE